MTTIINILATSNVANSFVRQPYEFYLAHKILERPDVYIKAREGNAYKIVDCSACELHTGLSMKKVLEAADIVGASEIILPDVVQSNDSLDISLGCLERLDSKTLNKYKIAVVIQGSNLKEGINSVRRLCSNHDVMVLIDTIMIPKWFSTSARVILTKEVQSLAPKKQIHWLGLGNDIAYCIAKAKELNIRTLDTGYFISIAEKGIYKIMNPERDVKHKIDLQHNKLGYRVIQQIIDITNRHMPISQSIIGQEIEKDEEFAQIVVRVGIFMLIVVAFVIVCVLIK